MEKASDKRSANAKMVKKNKFDFGLDFVAPDGGWGWFITIAAGCANVNS